MRIGNNPNKGAKATAMPYVVGIVVTHLPHLRGYHAGRLEVVQTCLNSMRDNAGRRIAICVWDNGSGPELRNWLMNEFRPEYLILSPNVGKSSARTATVRMFPPETVVCFSDDDILYMPNWLDPQLKLLKGFPNVGVVSGLQFRTQSRWGTESTLKWAKDNATVEIGRFIPDEWERDHCVSIGRSWDWHRDHYTAKDVDTRITYNGLTAYATAHHCQFIARAGSIEFLVEWVNDAVPDEKQFDKAVDAQGMLRLTTTERLARHMGNVIDDELRSVISNVRAPMMRRFAEAVAYAD